MPVDQCPPRRFRSIECWMNIDGIGFRRFAWAVHPACGDNPRLTIAVDQGRDDETAIVASMQDADGHVYMVERILVNHTAALMRDELPLLRAADSRECRRLWEGEWPREISASTRHHDPASWPVFEGEIHYTPVQECGYTTRAASLSEPPPRRLDGRLFGEPVQWPPQMPFPIESPVDKSDGFPNDLALSLDEWNAKIDAVLADVAQWQRQVEETNG